MDRAHKGRVSIGKFIKPYPKTIREKHERGVFLQRIAPLSFNSPIVFSRDGFIKIVFDNNTYTKNA